MITIVNSEECMQYSKKQQAESPLRIKESLKLLKKEKFEFIKPRFPELKELYFAHSRRYLSELQMQTFPYDEECPKYPKIFYYATLAAGAALTALENSLNGNNSFSLMRPPGHHAASKVSGFCYLNNAAIATIAAQEKGIERVAVLDIDYHNGNGTQEILLGRRGIIHTDLHEENGWPGTGNSNNQNCFNFLIKKDSNEKIYLENLQLALGKIINFNPKLLIVSAGFDTYKKDPVGGLGLEIESYKKIGSAINSTASELAIPICSVLEGGYSNKLPECILSYLKGFD